MSELEVPSGTPNTLPSKLTPLKRRQSSPMSPSANDSRGGGAVGRLAATRAGTPESANALPHAVLRLRSQARHDGCETVPHRSTAADFTELRDVVFHAARDGDSNALRELMETPTAPTKQVRECIDAYGPDGRSALLTAARAGHHEVISMLARAGADLSSSIQGNPQLQGVNAVFVAAQQGHVRVIATLADAMKRRGASDADLAAYVDAKAGRGFTPLLAAVMSAQHDTDTAAIVELLISLGADVRHAADGWTTAVHHAASRGKTATVKVLMQASCNDASLFDARDGSGKTPLLLAAMNNHVDAARTLISVGADSDAALVEAAQNNDARAIETLFSAIAGNERERATAAPGAHDSSNPVSAMPIANDVSLQLPPNLTLLLQRAASTRGGAVSRTPVIVSGTKRIILIPKLVQQNGHICKLAALANLDLLYATERAMPNIPLRKNRSGYYLSQINGHHSGPALTSIRETAKKFGSAQGEVLRIADLRAVAHEMGYSASALRPADIDACRAMIAEHIDNGTPLISFFQMSSLSGPARHGWPRTGGSERIEHAALIVGIDTGEDTVDLAHRGQVFPRIPLADLFDSMNALTDVRTPEVYERTADARVEEKRKEYRKYDLTRMATSDILSAHRSNEAVRISVVPTDDGFRNILLSVKPDESHPRWRQLGPKAD